VTSCLVNLAASAELDALGEGVNLVKLKPRDDEEACRNGDSEELEDEEDDTHGVDSARRGSTIESEEEEIGDKVKYGQDDLQVALQVVREHVTLDDDKDQEGEVNDSDGDELTERVGSADEANENTDEDALDPGSNDESAEAEVKCTIEGVARGSKGRLEEILLILDEAEPDEETDGETKTEDDPEDATDDTRGAALYDREGTEDTKTEVAEL